MFKSSFAQDLLQETRHQKHLQEEILPKEITSSVYKSQFAASTHGPLDNVNVGMDSDHLVTRAVTKFGPSHSVDNLNMNESSDNGNSPSNDLHTSDLGTSDFSSSELWPPSTSSSPFEYAPRYRQRLKRYFQK